MGTKPYSTEVDETGTAKASDPVMQENITKRCVNMADVMRESITLEESRKVMEERIYRFYHSEA